MRSYLSIGLICVSLAACSDGGSGNESDLAALDAELTQGQSASGADPQVMATLNDPIMVDPQLGAKSNADAIRPAPQPYAAPVPHPGVAAGSAAPDEKLLAAPAPKPLTDASIRQSITLASLAGSRRTKAAACNGRLAYSANWANRLPAELPLHPDARVTEAGGVEGNGCSMRVASFFVAKPAALLVDWYYTRAVRAGFSAEHQADGATHVLGGGRREGLTYLVVLTDRGDGGTDIDLITGR
ncbi:hypothetical protein COC42_16285 [Sphingomonas spermidinifaciens]|uniref:Uncharacterized protein n=1 Tax=Sphingomonas spermidinifaciens TaxID=1141889 RepID=A0A2A4B138_9SPHN|nr:hypothetical protein [Sphingomonas spermidinifaciens]PCD01675.1 hypothetical protein COC42_16285 [Sphingomonas spermidinifaciens]